MNEVNIDLPELWKCYKAKYMLVLYQYTVTPLQQERQKAAN